MPTLPLRSLLPFLPRVPLGVPGTASDSSLPAARVSFPRGGCGGRGGGGGAGTTLLLLRLTSLAAPGPSPAVPRGAPLPHPRSLLSVAGGAL